MHSETSKRLPGALALPQIPHPTDDAITVIPLGGCARIGMNATLYGVKGRWILVDVTPPFPRTSAPGSGPSYPISGSSKP